MVWLALLIGQSMGNGLPELLQNLMMAMQTPLEIVWTEDSMSSVILCSGAYLVGLLIYFSTQRNTRDGEEHGSAVWGSAKTVNRQFAQKKNKILTRNVRLGLDSKKHRRSLNVLVIGGSGASKTRSYVLPNILEASTNYVITDPKSEVLLATGGVLKEQGYLFRSHKMACEDKIDSPRKTGRIWFPLNSLKTQCFQCFFLFLGVRFFAFFFLHWTKQVEDKIDAPSRSHKIHGATLEDTTASHVAPSTLHHFEGAADSIFTKVFSFGDPHVSFRSDSDPAGDFSLFVF